MNIKDEAFCRNDYSSFNDFYEAVKSRIDKWQSQPSPTKTWCLFGNIKDELFTEKIIFLDSLRNHFLDERLCITIKLLDCDSDEAKALIDGFNRQRDALVKILNS